MSSILSKFVSFNKIFKVKQPLLKFHFFNHFYVFIKIRSLCIIMFKKNVNTKIKIQNTNINTKTEIQNININTKIEIQNKNTK